MNAVIVRDTRERMPLPYEQLIKELDVETPLVENQATIVDVSRDKMQELGLNWRYKNGRQEALLGQRQCQRPESGQRRPGVVPAGQGLLLSTILGDKGNFIARVEALEEDGSARVVSRPQVLTLSNQEALLANNQISTCAWPAPMKSICSTYPAGTALKVVPHVIRDGDRSRIRLLVNIEDGKNHRRPANRPNTGSGKSTLATQAQSGKAKACWSAA